MISEPEIYGGHWFQETTLSIAVCENTNCSRNRRNEQAGSAKLGAGNNGPRTGAEGDEPYEEELLVGEHPHPLRVPLVQPAPRAPQHPGFDDGVRGRRDSRNHLDGGVGDGGHRPVDPRDAIRGEEEEADREERFSVGGEREREGERIWLASTGVQGVKICCAIEPVDR